MRSCSSIEIQVIYFRISSCPNQYYILECDRCTVQNLIHELYNQHKPNFADRTFIYCLFPHMRQTIQNSHFSEKQNNYTFNCRLLLSRCWLWEIWVSLVSAAAYVFLFSLVNLLIPPVHDFQDSSSQETTDGEGMLWCEESLRSPTTEHPSVSHTLMFVNIL